MDDHPMVTTLVVWRLTSQAQRRAVVGRWCLSGNQTWHSQLHLTWLVGGWPTPLKNMSSSVGMIIPNIWKNNEKLKRFQNTNQMRLLPSNLRVWIRLKWLKWVWLKKGMRPYSVAFKNLWTYWWLIVGLGAHFIDKSTMKRYVQAT